MGPRKHKLLTKALAAKIPALYSTESTPTDEKMIVVKFFSPYSNWTWYVAEGQQEADGDWTFFGLVDGFEKEWGYFTLSELESQYQGGVPLVERDKWFTETSIQEVK